MGLGRFRLLGRAVFAATTLLVCTTSGRGQDALDLDGRIVNPLAADSGKVAVLIFVRRDCPVSGRYAPVIQQISKRYEDRANFWLVYPAKTDSPQAIRKYLQDYGYHLPALRDAKHALVKLAHAQITPQVAVFDRGHQLVYDGRIDNWYVDFFRARPAPTTHELDDAIRAALAGKPAPKSAVRGVGCYISDLQ
jgi:thioredoxin family protein